MALIMKPPDHWGVTFLNKRGLMKFILQRQGEKGGQRTRMFRPESRQV